MGQIILDPEELHNFRRKINQSIEDLQTQLRRTESAISQASESWKDNQFTQFQENFAQDKNRIKELQEVLRHYSDDVLYNLEQKGRNYLDVSMRI